MIHTTPADEALTATGHQNQIQLGVSHGCIHVKPADIDDMIRKLYLAKGNHIIVHPYYEAAPHEPIRVANPPYEVHFYPFSQKIYIRGERR